MKASEKELKMIRDYVPSKDVEKGEHMCMSDDEIIDFAKQYTSKKVARITKILDEIKTEYKNDQLYSDGYNAATNDCLEAVLNFYRKDIKL